MTNARLLYAVAMQVTFEITDTLASQLAAAGKDPASSALEALEDIATQEAIRQGQEDIAAGRTVPLAEGFRQFREKHGLAR